jgi:hypothetical protein
MIAALLGSVVRCHWTIENNLHRVMDMIFRDECRVRTDYAPGNFTTIKHMALNLLRTATSTDALRLRRKVALGTMISSQYSSPAMVFARFPCPLPGPGPGSNPVLFLLRGE